MKKGIDTPSMVDLDVMVSNNQPLTFDDIQNMHYTRLNVNQDDDFKPSDFLDLNEFGTSE